MNSMVMEADNICLRSSNALMKHLERMDRCSAVLFVWLFVFSLQEEWKGMRICLSENQKWAVKNCLRLINITSIALALDSKIIILCAGQKHPYITSIIPSKRRMHFWSITAWKWQRLPYLHSVGIKIGSDNRLERTADIVKLS